MLECSPCPYDCASCFDLQRCSTCNSSDYRVLNKTTWKCQPFPGYFDNNGADTCLQCMVGCLNCTSLTSCTKCDSSFTLNGGLCYGTCPIRSYPTVQNSMNSTCDRCPFDCFTCSSNRDCLSCSYADFRQINGVRCIPIDGYY